MADSKGINIPKSFEFAIPDDVPETWVDGVSGVITGWPVSKLVFHSVLPNKEGMPADVENRRAVLTMTIPTLVLIELSRNILASFLSGKQQLSDAAALYSSRTEVLLAGLGDIQPSSASTPPKASKGKKAG